MSVEQLNMKCRFSKLCNERAVRLGLCQHHWNWLNGVEEGQVIIEPAVVEAANHAPLDQKRVHSFLEAVSGTAIGFVISWAMLSLVISPLFHLKTNGGEDFIITCIFTVTSVLRSYGVRRLFNYLHVRRN